MITVFILATIIILTVVAVKKDKRKSPWITRKELIRFGEIMKNRGER